MVGHDNVAQNFEAIFSSCFFEDTEEGVSCGGSSKDRSMSDAAEIDGVILAAVLKSHQSCGHEWKFRRRRSFATANDTPPFVKIDKGWGTRLKPHFFRKRIKGMA